MTGPRVVGLLELISGQEPCRICGCKTWVVDGDGNGRAWLLCFGLGQDCVETRNLPANFVLEGSGGHAT